MPCRSLKHRSAWISDPAGRVAHKLLLSGLAVHARDPKALWPRQRLQRMCPPFETRRVLAGGAPYSETPAQIHIAPKGDWESSRGLADSAEWLDRTGGRNRSTSPRPDCREWRAVPTPEHAASLAPLLPAGPGPSSGAHAKGRPSHKRGCDRTIDQNTSTRRSIST